MEQGARGAWKPEPGTSRWYLGQAGVGVGEVMEKTGKGWRKGKELNSQFRGLGTGRPVCQEPEGAASPERSTGRHCASSVLT